jgi:hypothetical protein
MVELPTAPAIGAARGATAALPLPHEATKETMVMATKKALSRTFDLAMEIFDMMESSRER